MIALWAFLIGLNSWGATGVQCSPEEAQGGGPKMVERINQRYDDFYRYRHDLEVRDEERRKGVADVHAKREIHEKEMERALRDYEVHVRPRPDTSKLEAAYLAEQKQRDARLEAARECYVQQKEHALRLESHGRRIPEKLEYDIED
jgi:hypothetical protein